MNETKKVKLILILINIFVVIFVISLLVFLGFHYWDDIKILTTIEGQLLFGEKLKNSGISAVFILIFVNVLQVVVAFIPGEFVEIVSGMLFGPYFGLIVCLIGFTIGTMVIFGLVKLLGKPFIDLILKDKERKKLKFLENETRSLIVLFFVFLIPGTPKDFITYAIPFTKIKMWPFIIVTNIARIPSIITSTIIGDSLTKGEYGNAITVTIVTLVVAILGIIFNKPITNKVDKIVKKYQEKNHKV